LLAPCVENCQLNRYLLEAVGARRTGQSDDSGDWQLLPADPPDEAEALRALGAGCNGEGHAVDFTGGWGRFNQS